MLGDEYEPGREVECVRELVETLLKARAIRPEEINVAPMREGTHVRFHISTSSADQPTIFKDRPLDVILEAMGRSLGLVFTVALPEPKRLELAESGPKVTLNGFSH